MHRYFKSHLPLVEGKKMTRQPLDFGPFLEAQDSVYQDVLAELRNGRKTSHWIWYFFPQLAALGRSGTARFYGLADAAEAAAYLDHPVLDARLRQCADLVLAVEGRTAHNIFDSPDDLKVRSSMTLFLAAGQMEPVFRAVLNKYYGGILDPLTMALLASPAGKG